MYGELEYDGDLEVRGRSLNVRLIVTYEMDADGISYSTITSGDVFSERRKAWIELKTKLADLIYNLHYKALEEAVMDKEIDAHLGV